MFQVREIQNDMSTSLFFNLLICVLERLFGLGNYRALDIENYPFIVNFPDG